jgi:hypothetical protein
MVSHKTWIEKMDGKKSSLTREEEEKRSSPQLSSDTDTDRKENRARFRSTRESTKLGLGTYTSSVAPLSVANDYLPVQ